MLGLRLKLLLGFGGLLLIILVISIQGILRVSDLGQSIDVILRENYRSVIACQEMKESLERVDSATLFILLGYEREGRSQIEEHLARFDKAMHIQGGNITLPDEGEAFQKLSSTYSQFQDVLKQVTDNAQPVEARRDLYFTKLLPLFTSIKEAADHILQMNQQNMTEANMAARRKAAQASRRMYLLLISGTAVALVYVFLIRRWILRPIAGLIQTAEEIRKGNLDVVVTATSRDEIGQLSKSFDAMTASLRESRRNSRASLLRLQRSMKRAFDSLPDPVAVIDMGGKVELASAVLARDFDIHPEMTMRQFPYPHVTLLCNEALTYGHEIEGRDNAIIQRFIDGQERFFLPKAVPIMGDETYAVGVILVLQDVTPAQLQNEMKTGLISTVSHQLKTPLTSIRMALYLLLDDKLGPLTPKQEELVVAARDDSDRLNAIVEDLLDIARIQSGRIQMEMRSVDAAVLALDSIEPFKAQAQDRGIALSVSVPPDLPEVQADITRIPHVFANLMSNAIKYTSPGGRITVAAQAEGNVVRYSVSDTGSGIPPEYHTRVFEQFFRVPQEGKSSGAGLGLAIAKEIIIAHGGELSLDSVPGKGSTFSFSLKKAVVDEGAVVPRGANTAPEKKI